MKVIRINEDYKTLIDLALDLKDYKWAKELSEKIKVEQLHNNNKSNNKISYKAFDDMNNEIPVYLDGCFAKIPLTEDEVKNKLVMAKSKNGNKLIKKNESIDISYISEENQVLYRMFYYGWLQGRTNATELYENNQKLRNVINEYGDLIKMYDSQIEGYKKYIKHLETKKRWWQFWM